MRRGEWERGNERRGRKIRSGEWGRETGKKGCRREIEERGVGEGK